MNSFRYLNPSTLRLKSRKFYLIGLILHARMGMFTLILYALRINIRVIIVKLKCDSIKFLIYNWKIVIHLSNTIKFFKAYVMHNYVLCFLIRKSGQNINN